MCYCNQREHRTDCIEYVKEQARLAHQVRMLKQAVERKPVDSGWVHIGNGVVQEVGRTQ